MKSRVGERGQVTIPKELRDRLGIRPGTVMEFSEDRGRLLGKKVLEDDPFEHLIGVIQPEASVDELLTQMRGPAE